jgi:xylulokinase
MALVAGIDVGTQSTKVIVYDTQQKKIITTRSAPHRIISKPDGTREQEASWWTDAITTCFLAMPNEVRKQIAAIGVSGQQHGFVPVDKTGQVLHPVKLWNDTSTAQECQQLTDCAGGETSLLAQEGNLILPGYTASKVLWLKQHAPLAYHQLAYILLPHNYINYWLTGLYSCEYSDASGTALLDVPRRRWSKRLLHCIDADRDLSEALPPLIAADEVAGTVTEDIAALLGIPAGIPVSSGGGDNMMSAIGTGSVTEGTLTMSLGTSGTIFGISHRPIVDAQGYLALFCSATDSYLPLLCTMNCTVASELSRQLFSRSITEFNEIAAQGPIGADGVIMLPYFHGERTPNLPQGRGCIMGLHGSNMTEANICRAALEGAIFGLKLGLDIFKSLDYHAEEIRLIGGGANSSLWRSLVANICNLPVVIPQVTEAAAFGAALQAYWCLSHNQGSNITIKEITDEHVTVDTASTCLPVESDVVSYRSVYENYRRYAKAVEPLFTS